MTTPAPVASVHLESRRDLLRQGFDDTHARRLIAAGSWQRVRPGHYSESGEWAAAHAERRHAALAAAQLRAARGSRIIFSHITAAALWGLPIPTATPNRVHVLLPGRSAHSTATTIRHRAPFAEGDIVRLHRADVVVTDSADAEAFVTSLARTCLDVARMLPLVHTAPVLDAAFHRVAKTHVTPYGLDLARAEAFRHELSTAARALGRAPGVRRARHAIAFADARPESPGESRSRVLLDLAGHRVHELQRAVAGPNGEELRVDFDLGNALGEFDGTTKYPDDPAAARSAVLAEKRREDWIRGVTGMHLVRWDWADLRSAATLAARLRRFGVLPPGARG